MSTLLWSSQANEAKFFGAFEHSLDVKGRITLPVKFRGHFGDRCFLTRSQFGDPCVVVWTPDDFFGFANRINGEAWGDESSRRSIRTWAREAYEVELDRMGRMAIPAPLRALAELTKEVSVQGAVGTIELWSPVRWREYSDSSGVSSSE
ncbi:MAG: division/cell wall cluster transcriptional repressor MraZ [Acidimicrobiales bacterium]